MIKTLNNSAISIYLTHQQIIFSPCSLFFQVQHSLSDWNDTRSFHVVQGWLHCLLLHIQCRSQKTVPTIFVKRTTIYWSKKQVIKNAESSLPFTDLPDALWVAASQRSRGGSGGESWGLFFPLFSYTSIALHFTSVYKSVTGLVSHSLHPCFFSLSIHWLFCIWYRKVRNNY